MTTAKPAKKPETIVSVPCPRCGGKGGRPDWSPDQGVCYLCKGKCSLDVNLERGERHLEVLRKEYVRARNAKNKIMMSLLATKGIQKRALVDEAKAIAAKVR